MTLEPNNGTTLVNTDELFAAVRELRLAGRWERASRLLEATVPGGPEAQARIARAAAEVALERDWFAGTDTAAERITDAEKAFPDGDWDVAFLRLRHTYGRLLFVDGSLRRGPDGKDPESLEALLRRARELHDDAPDAVRRGWAAHYVGLITDNHLADSASAAAHYAAALRAGESGPDDLLAREALRHLGGQDHDAGAYDRALDRWRRATALGAGQGTVPGTLSQHLVLAVLARDTGDEAGARALATETVRWAEAIGATRLAAQATGFLAEPAPTTPRSEDGN